MKGRGKDRGIKELERERERERWKVMKRGRETEGRKRGRDRVRKIERIKARLIEGGNGEKESGVLDKSLT